MAYDHLEIEARWGTILGEDNERMSKSRGNDGIAPRLAGQAVRKFVYVPGAVVNLVVG